MKKIDTKIELKRTINLLSGSSIIVGIIVGSGIFITTKGVLENAGTPGISLIVWLIAGLISLIGAICFTELGTLIPSSGGNYAYLRESYGGLVAFLYIWAMVFVCLPAFNAISALTVSMYLVRLFLDNCEHTNPIIFKIIAAMIICLLGFMNCFNMKVMSKIQVAFTLTKVLALLFVIGAGFWSFFNSSISAKELVKDWWIPEKKESINLSKISLSLYNSLFAYSGWNCLNFLTEEIKDSSKNLPRAIYISIPSVVIIYLIVNLSYFVVLTPHEILVSETVALTFGEKVFHKSISFFIPILIAFSGFGSLSGNILSTSRIYYAAARDGNLPEIFGMINVNYFSPVTSILFTTLMALLMLLAKDLDLLILYATFSEFLFTSITISAVLYLRYKWPDVHREIKVFLGFPVFFLIICLFMIVLTVYQHPNESLNAFILLTLGIPVYIVAVMWTNKPIFFRKAIAKFTILCQKIFVCSKEA